MTYQSYETSQEGGSPVELYEITLGSDIYRITSAQDEILAMGNDFYPIEIERGSLVVGPEERDDMLALKVPASYSFVRKYIKIVPGQRAFINVFRFHRSDGGTPEIVLYWKGIVRSVTFTEQGLKATIAALPLTGALSREVPRYGYQGLCNHVLYDARCQLLETIYRHNGKVLSVSENTLQIENLELKGDGWATGGYVTAGGLDYRLVLSHTNDEIRLILPFPSDISILGSNVDVYAGCDHTTDICISKFNNFINFGGYPWVPRKNPFETGIG